MWLCGYGIVWLCGDAAERPCGYGAMWLRGYMAIWLCGYGAILNFVRIPQLVDGSSVLAPYYSLDICVGSESDLS